MQTLQPTTQSQRSQPVPQMAASGATTSPWTEPFQAAFERQSAASQAEPTTHAGQQRATSATQSGREGTYSPNR